MSNSDCANEKFTETVYEVSIPNTKYVREEEILNELELFVEYMMQEEEVRRKKAEEFEKTCKINK